MHRAPLAVIVVSPTRLFSVGVEKTDGGGGDESKPRARNGQFLAAGPPTPPPPSRAVAAESRATPSLALMCCAVKATYTAQQLFVWSAARSARVVCWWCCVRSGGVGLLFELGAGSFCRAGSRGVFVQARGMYVRWACLGVLTGAAIEVPGYMASGLWFWSLAGLDHQPFFFFFAPGRRQHLRVPHAGY